MKCFAQKVKNLELTRKEKKITFSSFFHFLHCCQLSYCNISIFTTKQSKVVLLKFRVLSNKSQKSLCFYFSRSFVLYTNRHILCVETTTKELNLYYTQKEFEWYSSFPIAFLKKAVFLS